MPDDIGHIDGCERMVGEVGDHKCYLCDEKDDQRQQVESDEK